MVLGTPFGGDRLYEPRTPEEAANPDKLARLETIRVNMASVAQVPQMPGSASTSEQPVTMAALRDLFDEKLQPVTDTVIRLARDLEELRCQAEENNKIAMTNVENVAVRIGELRGEMGAGPERA